MLEWLKHVKLEQINYVVVFDTLWLSIFIQNCGNCGKISWISQVDIYVEMYFYPGNDAYGRNWLPGRSTMLEHSGQKFHISGLCLLQKGHSIWIGSRWIQPIQS